MSNLIRALIAPVEHGCLVLRDEQSKAEHSQWDPTVEPYQVKDDSVIFSVQPSVDGPVHVRIWRGSAGSEEAAEQYFDARLRSAHGRVVLHDPNDDASLTFRVAAGLNSIRVQVDSVEFPEFIDVLFLEMED